MSTLGVVAVLWSGADPETYVPTIRSLLADDRDLVITVGGADKTLLRARAALLHSFGARVDPAPLPDLVEAATELGHVLLALRPILIAPGTLRRGAEVLADPRVATLSFWCNDASYMSFPHRNTPSSHQIEALDEVLVNERLRSQLPALEVVPVPAAVGPVGLLGQAALSALGGLDLVDDAEVDASIFLHSMAAQRRAFVCLLDPSTYVAAPFDLSPPAVDVSADPVARERAVSRAPAALAVVDRDRNSISSPLALAHGAARAKVMGVRVLIDGTCLGPKEMGTQVQTLSLVRALAQHQDVASIEVTHAAEVPAYAAGTLGLAKVRAIRVRDDRDVGAAGTADVAHRPFQPDRVLDEAWRQVAARTVVTVQDLIAYRTGAYHVGPAEWLSYRDGLWASVSRADGTVAFSKDVCREIQLERLPVPSERLFVVECGTDHLAGDEPSEAPLLALGAVGPASRFVLVVGANYAHKNRDLAIGAVRILRDRGFKDLGLVLVGAAVPFGSSRVEEAVAHGSQQDEWCVSIPDVPSAQRNWLLRHAELVLYPTTAEGFGLVPFEAAHFGTPVVTVPFGPLAEVVPDSPVSAADWDPRSLADATAELLGDPRLVEAQVAATLRAGESYTWHRTAAGLVEVYRQVLAYQRR